MFTLSLFLYNYINPIYDNVDIRYVVYDNDCIYVYMCKHIVLCCYYYCWYFVIFCICDKCDPKMGMLSPMTHEYLPGKHLTHARTMGANLCSANIAQGGDVAALLGGCFVIRLVSHDN